MNRFARLAAGLALACSSNLAFAGLLGTNVSQCANSAYVGLVTADASACAPATVQPTPASAVVDGSVEFSLAGNRFLDFDDSTLTVSYVQPVNSFSPDLFVFTMETAVTGVTLLGANPLAITWTFAGNQLGVLVNSPLVDGSVVFQIDTAAVAVPEPGSVSLALLALLGLATFGGARRHRF